ncbi:PDR/VanB family oxidoreductase [Rhodococcoides fascians]|uniref:PDR/VanB family oxidoreductase n=1 Tax=Rhodococcoides fascians TaxID=1828 RepID=UPI00195DE044|nr:PDR/VanB family oxidoreductase [Rhodococcus fascians]MDQ0282236.1 vanillate O-demethylase ferredoxin subunit [Rhodococcus fascians]
MSSVKVVVAQIVDETPNIRSLRLVRDGGGALGPYQAGAHIDVTGPTGVLRQYSLCGPPAEPDSLLIAVKRELESRGGSEALHRIREGDVLEISEPRNILGVAPDADAHVLIAAGIGVTPLLSMAYQLHHSSSDFQLHYFSHSREHTAFLELLEDRAEFRDSVHLHIGLSRTQQRAVLDGLAGSVSASSAVYTCGPEGFMETVVSIFTPTVGPNNVHIEHFVASDIDTSGDTGFTVEMDTGESFEIPADRSILSVLEENGIEVFKSCEEGICGSCVSGLLEGEPEHRDNCLSAADKAAGNQIALCVSRAKSSKLVIELY